MLDANLRRELAAARARWQVEGRLPAHTPLDVAGIDPHQDIGWPGEYPYTRGLYPAGYRAVPWVSQQFAGYGLAADANDRFHYLMRQGQGHGDNQPVLNVAFDMPTHHGYDSDDPKARGEVGRVGVAVDSLADMEDLFSGFALERAFVSMVVTGSAAPLLAMYVALARRQGVPLAQLRGVQQNDPLKAFVASKFFALPPRPAVQVVVDMMAYAERHLPRWNVMGVSGYHIREAGGTAVHEIAFALCNAAAYVEAALARGISADSAGARISFSFQANSHFLAEIAKLRAARRLWARLMRERFGATEPRAQQLRMHIQTSGVTLTAQQPENNIIRTTIQAMAAVLAGCQSLHVNSMDEALGLPTEEAVRVSLQTQHIIAAETGVTATVDPFGGSYYLESLTSQSEAAARKYLTRVEQMGNGSLLDGTLRGLDAGFFHQEIADAAARFERQLGDKSLLVVGVNEYVETDDSTAQTIKVFRCDPRVEEMQHARLRRLRAERDGQQVSAALTRLDTVLRSGENVMEPLVEAAASYCTLGEIMQVMTGVHGRYVDPLVF